MPLDKDKIETPAQPEEEEKDLTPETPDNTEEEAEDSEANTEDNDEAEDEEEETIPYSKHVALTNEVIKNRVARERKVRHREFEQVAGTRLEKDEPTRAAALWGILKTNPELSEQVDKVITDYMNKGHIPAARPRGVESSALDVREARLELMEDPNFKPHEDEFMDWAEGNEFNTSSPRELKLAWKDYKAENASRFAATKAFKEGAPSKKAADAQKAKLETGGRPKGKAVVDWNKDDPMTILRKTGMKLYTED